MIQHITNFTQLEQHPAVYMEMQKHINHWLMGNLNFDIFYHQLVPLVIK